MELHYKEYGSGKPFIILHGLFGSSDNWHSHARKLGDYFKVYTLDQRNHGDSDWSDDFDYDIMAEDLHAFIEKHQLDDFILMGHSMGGKTAMRYAQLYPDKIDKLIIVDMGIKGYPITHDVLIEGMKSIDLSALNSRKEADEQMAQFESSYMVRQFLLKNLHRSKEGFAWKINIRVLEEQLPVIIGPLPTGEVMVDTLFMAGGQSDYILPEDHDTIRNTFPLASFYTIEEAGHWIHAQAPKEFIDQVLSFALL